MQGSGPELAEWRRATLDVVVWVLCGLSVPAILGALSLAYVSWDSRLLLVSLGVTAVVAGLALSRQAPVRLRAGGLLATIVALYLFTMFCIGPTSSVHAWAMALCVLSAVFFGQFGHVMSAVAVTVIQTIAMGSIWLGWREGPAGVEFFSQIVSNVVVLMLASFCSAVVAQLIGEAERAVRQEGTEAALRRSLESERERLVLAIQQASVGLGILNQDGSLLYVNPSMRQLTGHSNDEQSPQSLYDLLADRYSGPPDGLAEAMTAGEPWRAVLRCDAPDTTAHEIELTASPMRDSQGRITHALLVARDVGREQALERELAQARRLEAIGTPGRRHRPRPQQPAGSGAGLRRPVVRGPRGRR